jgi:hypothetical protein
MPTERIKGTKQKRGRPPISPVVWSLIRDEVQRHPEKLRKELADELENEITLKGQVPPTRQTLIKLISKARNRNVGSSPEDDLWHLDAFDECAIPADALPVILEIQKHIDKNLSIRLVKWLTRLYMVLKGRQFLKGNELFYCLYCYLWASEYADREKVSEISRSLGTPISFDSSDLDVGLLDDNPLSPPLKPYVLDLLDTGVLWLAGADESVVGKVEKEHFGMSLAEKIEEALIGHNLGGSESGGALAGVIWLVYVSLIIRALKRGYFFGLSNEETEAQLERLRQGVPEEFDSLHQSGGDLKSFFHKEMKMWESLRIKKEGQS